MGRKNTKETNRSKKEHYGVENHMTERNEEKENMTEIVMDKKSMIEYDNNKKHTYEDEDSNMEIALSEDNPTRNHSSSILKNQKI
jgi:hypothetical protein